MQIRHFLFFLLPMLKEETEWMAYAFNLCKSALIAFLFCSYSKVMMAQNASQQCVFQAVCSITLYTCINILPHIGAPIQQHAQVSMFHSHITLSSSKVKLAYWCTEQNEDRSGGRKDKQMTLAKSWVSEHEYCQIDADKDYCWCCTISGSHSSVQTSSVLLITNDSYIASFSPNSSRHACYGWVV